MKLNRAILLLTAMLIGMHGAGILSTFHNLTHHTQDTAAHSCSGDQTSENQAPKAPIDQQQDKDCDLCLTLHSITPTLADSSPLPTYTPTRTLVSACVNPAIQTPLLLSDRSTRAPPLS